MKNWATLKFSNFYRQKSREHMWTVKGMRKWWKEHRVYQAKFTDVDSLSIDSAFNVAAQRAKKEF